MGLRIFTALIVIMPYIAHHTMTIVVTIQADSRALYWLSLICTDNEERETHGKNAGTAEFGTGIL